MGSEEGRGGVVADLVGHLESVSCVAFMQPSPNVSTVYNPYEPGVAPSVGNP